MGFVGTMAVSRGRFAIPEGARLFLMVGICGGFTTFSSFSLDTFAIAQTGDWFKAATNVTLSVDSASSRWHWDICLPASLLRVPLFPKLVSRESQSKRMIEGIVGKC
jgi:hypothetical protein